MYKDYARRLTLAQDARLRKHHAKPGSKKKFSRPSSHLESFLDELSEDVRGAPESPTRQRDLYLAPVALAGVAEGMAVAAAQDVADKTKKVLTARARRAALKKRRSYYAAENAKRKEWNRQIKKAVPRPLHACPKPSALKEAYLRRRESEEWKVRFGELMVDLEEHARRSYEISGNKFTGSSGGVKEWLAKHCPILAKHYATCQRYKRIVQDDPRLFRETED